jgi:hypothetical protein
MQACVRLVTQLLRPDQLHDNGGSKFLALLSHVSNIVVARRAGGCALALCKYAGALLNERKNSKVYDYRYCW